MAAYTGLERDRLRQLYFTCSSGDGTIAWPSCKALFTESSRLWGPYQPSVVHSTEFSEFVNRAVSVDPEVVGELEAWSRQVESLDVGELGRGG